MLNGDRSMADHEDMSIPYCVGTVEEAVEIIRAHKSVFDAAAPKKSSRSGPEPNGG